MIKDNTRLNQAKNIYEKNRSLEFSINRLAHEINTPIGVCITATSCLKHVAKKLQDKLQTGQVTKTEFSSTMTTFFETLSLIEKNLSRADDVIFNFQQTVANKNTDKNSTVDLLEEIRAIIRNFDADLKRHSVEVDLDCSQCLIKSSHQSDIEKILSKLISNSLRYWFKDTITQRTIKLRVTEKQKFLQIEYSDNSFEATQGITKSDIKTLVTTRNQGTVGLGVLFISHIVKNRLKGRIYCTKKEGEGYYFTIKIPNFE